jgi:hypothetical protein
MHQGYFGHLIRMIKIYSTIQTNDEEINRCIMERAELWEKFSLNILRPY